MINLINKKRFTVSKASINLHFKQITDVPNLNMCVM